MIGDKDYGPPEHEPEPTEPEFSYDDQDEKRELERQLELQRVQDRLKNLRAMGRQERDLGIEPTDL